MRILVTGGAGFLGSHLCDRLLELGHEVLAVDNLYTGRKENIHHNLSNPNFEFIRHDVTIPLYVEVDGIFNFACPASPIHYQSDPVQTLKTSVHGAINMLGLAKRTGARILQASTSEVYGDPEVSPQQESYWGNVNPIGIRSCYDEGKRAAETLFTDYHRQHNLDKSLNVICDGVPQGNETVSGGGSVTFDRASTASYEVGLPITVYVKTMPVEVKLQTGTRVGFKKRIVETNVIVNNTQHLNINDQPVPFQNFDNPLLDIAISPFTGIKRLNGIRGYTRDAVIEITQTLPLKMTLLGLEYKVAVNQGT